MPEIAAHFAIASNTQPVLYTAKGVRLRKKCKETCDNLHADESLPFGCWFFQFKFVKLKRCDLLLAPSFPSTLYDIVPTNDTFYMFRTCLQREYALTPSLS